MLKVPLEIVIPIYNEGDKVVKLLDQFQILDYSKEVNFLKKLIKSIAYTL